MNENAKMTPEQEHAFYADADNQAPQGPARRRRARLSEPVPVRLPPEVLAAVRERARADDRSVSSWVRRAVEHELDRAG
jgi:predicted HicB family RNase H-like nuclease